MDISPNSKVAFYQQNLLLIGEIEAENSGVYKVRTLIQGYFELRAGRFIMIGESPLSLSDFIQAVDSSAKGFSEEQFDFLNEAEFNLEAIAARLKLGEAYELFGIYQFLKAHPELFHHKKDLFRKLSAEEREAYQDKQIAENARAIFLEKVNQLVLGKPLEPETQLQLYSELASCQANGISKDLAKIIHKAFPELDSEAALLQFRRFCGELPEKADPALSRSGLPVHFPVLLNQQNIAQTNHTTAPHSVFCIDAEDSKDYDDAISLENVGENLILGIHVSCVASAISPQSLLFAEAERRVSSLYLTNMVVPMFPPEFSESALSLVKEQIKPSLSLYVTLDSDFNVKDKTICIENVIPEANLSYNEVDKDIGREPFKTLFALSGKLSAQRDSLTENTNSHVYHYLRFLDNRFQVIRVDTESPSRRIVEELMILYNSSLADFAQKNQIPVLYRNVQQFSVNQSPYPATQAYLSTQAMFHPGIGCAAYLHASSPVRRYVDLINQHQLVASLTGNPQPFSAEQLNTQIERIEKRLNLIKDTVHQSERWWWLQYLAKHWLGEPLDAYLLQTQHNRLKLELIKWGVQVWMECSIYPRQEQIKVVFYGLNADHSCVCGDIL